MTKQSKKVGAGATPGSGSGSAPRSGWITTHEAAQLLRLKPRTIYHLVSKNRIPHTRAGGKLLFTREQLEAWLAMQSQRPQPQTLNQLPNTIAGSHDPLLEWAVRESQCGIALSCRGSSDGLDQLLNRQACAALIHIPNTTGDGYNRQALQARCAGLAIASIRWTEREQGLLLASGNPLALHTVSDMARAGVRIVMRQAGAGSDLLLAKLLSQAGVPMRQLLITEPRVPTETDVAQTVADDLADVGFAIKAAARAHRLDFIPIVQEQVELVFWREAYFAPALQALLGVLNSSAMAKQAARLTGYQQKNSGTVAFNG